MTRRTRILATALLASLVTISAFAALHFGRGRGSARPAAQEFGTGPRTSAKGLYSATLVGAGSLKPRKMYALQVAITDAAGKPLPGAVITVDGGMPQHGHGLPTRPRVTKDSGNGSYEISGLRFNMGGWWELKLEIRTPAGTDTVTFNLDI